MVTIAVIVMTAVLLAITIFHPAGRAHAYLTGGDEKENTLTPGGNTSQIVEEYSEPALTAGENIFDKCVTVQNTGDIPCYVRVFLAFSDSAVADCSELSQDGTTFVPLADYRTGPGAGWSYSSDDGFFYYAPVLEPGESTTPLLQKVKTTFPDQESVQSYEILVYEETVQTKDAAGNDLPAENACRLAFAELMSTASEDTTNE